MAEKEGGDGDGLLVNNNPHESSALLGPTTTVGPTTVSTTSPLQVLLGTLCVAVNIICSTLFMLIVQSFGDGNGPVYDRPFAEVIFYHIGMIVLIPCGLVLHLFGMRKKTVSLPLPWKALFVWVRKNRQFLPSLFAHVRRDLLEVQC